jgi:hypothetical protein
VEKMEKVLKSKVKTGGSFYLYGPELVELFEFVNSNYKSFKFVLGEYSIDKVEDFNDPQIYNYKTNDLDIVIDDPYVMFFLYKNCHQITLLDSNNAMANGFVTKIAEMESISNKKYGKPDIKDYALEHTIINKNSPDSKPDEEPVKVKMVQDKKSFLERNRDPIIVGVFVTIIGTVLAYLAGLI